MYILPLHSLAWQLFSIVQVLFFIIKNSGMKCLLSHAGVYGQEP
ncbi:hypothetical protein LDG_7514 [Legionella drancourtii LLAP12]|uniref:Uncharacterized protein n=1 Tax=Legionella drancourtii LLAP12 TaxID=658187 RepID=G9EQG7_9GAMM|nr:hypothetical protein LDG_7514 [Legionella drancourtii LLAP12]